MHDPEDAIKKWNDPVSTLKMCHTIRELQGLDGEPMDFECKIFPGATALDILHKIRADLQGKHITPENFSDRIIFMTMFNDIVLEKKNNEDSCALTSRKIKEYASTFNDGQWAFLGPGEESKWYQGCATNHDGKWDPVFRGISPLKKKNNRDTIHFNEEYCNIDLLCRTVHSANQLCIYGATSKWCGPNSGGASQSRPESARKMSPEIQLKKERSQVIGWYSETAACFGKPNASEFERFQFDAILWKIEYLRTTAKFYHPIEKGNHKITTTLEDDRWGKRTSMCKEYTAPRNREDSKPYASIDGEKESDPVSYIEIATIIDVPCIEVQVPSMSSPGYPVWIW